MPLPVRLHQRRRDLGGVEERCLGGARSLFQPRRQCFALHQFHHQVVGSNVVKRADVGMVQGGNRPGLALKPGVELLAIGFDGDGAA